jgi:hypothetical protein
MRDSCRIVGDSHCFKFCAQSGFINSFCTALFQILAICDGAAFDWVFQCYRLKSIVLWGITHFLRSPLRIILWWTYLILTNSNASLSLVPRHIKHRTVGRQLKGELEKEISGCGPIVAPFRIWITGLKKMAKKKKKKKSQHSRCHGRLEPTTSRK